MFFSFLLSLIPGLSSIASKYQDYKMMQVQAQIEIAKLQTTVQIAEQEAGSKVGIALIKGIPTWLRVFAFMVVTLPMLLTIFFPPYAQLLWNNLSLAPEWYTKLVLALYLGIFGIVAGQPVIAGIFSGVTSYLGTKNEQRVVSDIAQSVANPASSFTAADAKAVLKRYDRVFNATPDQRRAFIKMLEDIEKSGD